MDTHRYIPVAIISNYMLFVNRIHLIQIMQTDSLSDKEVMPADCSSDPLPVLRDT